MNRTKLINQIVFSFICFRKGLIRTMPKEGHQLPIAQGEALFSVAHSGEMTITHLAKHLNITPGATTQLVEALVKAGLLKRQTSSSDRRVVTVKLSNAGEAYIAEIKKHKFGQIKKTLEVLSDGELMTLAELLDKVSSTINKEESW